MCDSRVTNGCACALLLYPVPVVIHHLHSSNHAAPCSVLIILTPPPPFCLPRISPPLLSSFTYHWRLNKTLQHIVHLLEMHLNTLSGSVFLFSVVQITPFSLHQLPQPHRSDRSFTAAYGRERVGVFYIYMLL